MNGKDYKENPKRSPWPDLMAFVAVLIFGGLAIALHWNNGALNSVIEVLTILFGIWRFVPGDD